MDKVEFVGRSMTVWIVAGAIAAAVCVVLPVVRRALHKRLKGEGELRRESIRALFAGLVDWWLLLSTLGLAAGLAATALAPPPEVVRGLRIALVAIGAMQAAVWGRTALLWGIRRYIASRTPADQEPDPALVGAMSVMRWIGALALYVAIALLAMENLGINVTALIAGLGIGGIAAALAAQSILGDLFASLSIALDKPFVVGDFVVAGAEMGTIEQIGVKTTRVRSITGEQLVIPNSDLLSSRIRNFKRMSERRALFGFGVVYGTPVEALERIPEMVRECVEGQPQVRFERCHLMRFGASSLDYETVYFVNSPDYNVHMDVQQAIHLGIARRFRDEGIEFAFPTQTVHIAATGAESERAGAAAARGRARDDGAER